MKPILYPANESNFNTNGLGRLSDAVSCVVTEERNGSYELEMSYPVTGMHFSDIQRSRIIYAVPADGKNPQAFRIYKITKPLNGIVTVFAEHISYQLSHIPVEPFETTTIGGALTGLVDYSAEANPFTFWTDKTTVANFSVKEPTSCRALLGGMQGSILDAFGGGDYEFDMYTVKLYQDRGYDRGVTLRYGKNIIDINQEENIENTYTGVMPFWKKDDDQMVMLPEKVLHSANASNFPYQRTIPLDLSSEWEEAPTQAQLRSKATSYMTENNIGVPSVSLKVNFVALWQTEEYKNVANLERVNLCDLVTIEFPALEISAKAKVVKTTYDVLLERYREIELGEARANLAKSISTDMRNTANKAVESAPSASFIRRSIERATNLIQGGLGGYVVMTPNADGEPQEILIMDTDDIQTAVNVIRINKNGIGFSTNGYEGPFASAWTIDGHFNADFITAGAINAALITAGTMSANRIQGGTLVLGGVNNAYGVLSVLNANGTEVGRIDRDGANISGNIKMVYENVMGNSGLVNVYSWDYFAARLYERPKAGFADGYYSNGSFVSGHTLNPTSTSCVSSTVARDTTERLAVVLAGATKTTSQYGAAYDNAHAFRERVETSGVEWYYVDGTLSTNSDIYFKMKPDDIGFGNPYSWQDAEDVNPGSSYNYFYHKFDRTGYFGSSGGHYLRWGNSGFKYDGHTVSVASSSSKRYKHDIKPLSGDRDPHKLLSLEAKEFMFNDDHLLQYEDMKGQSLPGFIAEDVAEIYPSAVIHDEEGMVESWDERRIIPAMLSLIQEQHEEIQALKSELAEIKELLKGVVK